MHLIEMHSYLCHHHSVLDRYSIFYFSLQWTVFTVWSCTLLTVKGVLIHQGSHPHQWRTLLATAPKSTGQIWRQRTHNILPSGQTYFFERQVPNTASCANCFSYGFGGAVEICRNYVDYLQSVFKSFCLEWKENKGIKQKRGQFVGKKSKKMRI